MVIGTFRAPPLVVSTAGVVMILLGLAAGTAYLANRTIGTTRGPDFIADLKSGALTAASVTSIEVVQPSQFHPTDPSEYAALKRLRVITAPGQVREVTDQLQRTTLGHVQMNHAEERWSVYLRVNTPRGFYWIDCALVADPNRVLYLIKANNLNATNVNGATEYYVRSEVELSRLLDTPPPTVPAAASPR